MWWIVNHYLHIFSHHGKNDAPHLDDLKKHLEESYTSTPMIIGLEEVCDIKKWVGYSIEVIRGHSAPYHYRFKRVGAKVGMTYKHWSDDEWETPECNTPLDLIMEAANLPSTTSLVTPDFTSLKLESWWQTWSSFQVTTYLRRRWRCGTFSLKSWWRVQLLD